MKEFITIHDSEL